MPIENNITSDDAAREIYDLLRKGSRQKPNFIAGEDATSNGGVGDLVNPMQDDGDLIYGGVAGAPRRRAIGDEGDVLSVEGGVPVWIPSIGATRRYRDAIYSTYGGGSLLWDSDGHLMYELRELE
jgi:hypothetical protein